MVNDEGSSLLVMISGSMLSGKSALARQLLDAKQTAIPAGELIVDDLPGIDPLTPKHTRNVVASALAADVAIVVIDANRGMDAQIRRHSYLAWRCGIPTIVAAVNKLDVVGDDRHVFDSIAAQFQEFARAVGMPDVACVPACALTGENVTRRGLALSWYRGPTLLEYLARTGEACVRPFRLSINHVAPLPAGRTSISGRVLSGAVDIGDRVRCLPSGREGTVFQVAAPSQVLRAVVHEQIDIALDEDVGARAGDLLAAAQSPPGLASQFEATIFWASDAPMLPGRAYVLRSAGGAAETTPSVPKYALNLDTLKHEPARTLRTNSVGVCNLNLDHVIAFDPFEANRSTGAFRLYDRLTDDAVAAGLLHFALRRSQNIHWQAIEVDKAAHRALKGHRSCVVWFTGLSGAGKSTIANLVEKKLHASSLHTYLLDGDNIRHGLNKDLGFTQADRVENIRRIAEVARLMADAGLIVLVSFISPFRAERRFARGLVDAGEFCEVFVDAPLEVAEARDRKGLYRKARSGQLVNFTGIDSPYEPPERPDVTIDTTSYPPEAAAEAVVARLRAMGIFGPE